MSTSLLSLYYYFNIILLTLFYVNSRNVRSYMKFRIMMMMMRMMMIIVIIIAAAAASNNHCYTMCALHLHGMLLTSAKEVMFSLALFS